MTSAGVSHRSGKVPHAPKAEAETAQIDDIEDEFPSADGPSQMSTSQCSTIFTADSRRASSQSTLQSPDKNSGYLRTRKMVVCRISLLDGTTFEPKGIDKNSSGQVVFDKVVQHLDLIETDYFGLTYRDKTGKKYWIDNTKKISNQVKGGIWVFEFQVKFYPPDPQSLKEDLTRYQLCLQVRVDIFNGRLPCSFVTYALLGSYTVQAELGDYDPVEYSGNVEYLKDFDFAPSQQVELLEKIAELHKYHKGQTPEEAESNFLENAKKLAMYGVDLHDVKDSENKPLVLGIHASGILVYKDRLRINRFVWPKILKLEYKRNIFYVQTRPGILEPKEKTHGFRLDNHKLAKRLWKICVEHHAFFRLKDVEGMNQGTMFPRFNTKFRYSGRTQAQAKKAAEAQSRDAPHITRTAERRSLVKAKPLDMDEMENSRNQHGHPDEKDMYDKMKGDPTATAGLKGHPDQSQLDKDGKQMRGPGGEGEDRRDRQPGEGDRTEGMPGYEGDTSGLTEGGVLGAKGKKDKEDEKKRKKEEERRKKEEEKRRKEEEKERKRLEKDRKKKGDTTEDRTDKMGDVDATETAINGHADPAELERGKDKKAGKGGEDGTKYETNLDVILAGKGGVTKDLDEDGRKRGEGRHDERDRDRYGRGDDRHGRDRDGYGRDQDREGRDRDREGRDRYREGKDRDRHGKNHDRHGRDHDRDGKDRDRDGKDRDKHGKDKDKHGKDGEGKDDKHGKKDDGKDAKHGKKGEKGDSFKGDKDKKGGLFGKFGKKSPSKKGAGEDGFPAPPSPLGDQKQKAGMVWALPGIDELKERQQSSGQQGGFAPGDYGMSPGDDKSIDRKMQFMPVVPPTVETRDKNRSDNRMPFFQPAGESSTDDSGSLGRKGPPPVAKKPKGPGGYDSEEDRLLRSSGEMDASHELNPDPPTVQTESFKYTPNLDEIPMSTSKIPIVETKTHTVTYEKDGVPFETEDSVLISAHSVTTKSQTIDTTTYKTERDGIIETRVERKITVTSDEQDDIDHDMLLVQAIEAVTRMNPNMSVERIEHIKHLEADK